MHSTMFSLVGFCSFVFVFFFFFLNQRHTCKKTGKDLSLRHKKARGTQTLVAKNENKNPIERKRTQEDVEKETFWLAEPWRPQDCFNGWRFKKGNKEK